MPKYPINQINAKINEMIGYKGNPTDGYKEHSDKLARLLKLEKHPNQLVASLGVSGGILGFAAADALKATVPNKILAGAAAAGLSGLAAYAYRQRALKGIDDAMHTQSRFSYLLDRGFNRVKQQLDQEVNSI